MRKQLWAPMEKRILKRVMIDDESTSEIDITFTTLMGDKVEPRSLLKKKCSAESRYLRENYILLQM